jgi:hypothetical protein
MPFTLAHPAAALPLWTASRRRFRLAALVLGSATPDYQYFINPGYPQGGFGHSLQGLFLICLPAGWLSLYLYDRYGRAGIQMLLPDGWRLPPAPPRNPFWPTTLALLLAAAIHIVWDGFTHSTGLAVYWIPALSVPVFAGIPRFRVLQHFSTLVGLTVLGIASWRWSRSQPYVSPAELLRRAIVPFIVLAAVGVANGFRFVNLGLQQFVVGGGVAVTFVAGLVPVLLGIYQTFTSSGNRPHEG